MIWQHIFFSGAFTPTSEICTTPLPLLAAMKKPIRDWTNRPLSTLQLSTSTPLTLKYESVSSSQMIGSITYGILKKHISIYIRKIYCVQAYLRHINVLKHISLLTMLGWLNGTSKNLGSNPQAIQYPQLGTIGSGRSPTISSHES
jgi:hypothetical protein